MFRCPWCDKEMRNESAVVRHASRVHKKTRVDYDLLIKHGGKIPLCACGCGQEVEYSQHFNGFNKFVHSHQTRDPEIRETMIKAGQEAARDPKILEENKRRTTELWQDPTFVEKHMAMRRDPDSHWSKSREASLRPIWESEEFARNSSEKMKEWWTTEAGDEMRAKCASPEFKEAVSIGTKKAFEDNDEAREKLSLLASKNQALGVIGPNMTNRQWVMNPFVNEQEHLDSGWEVSVLEEAIKRGVPIRRNHEVIIKYTGLDGRQHRYVPDFVSVTGQTVIEVKGMKTETDGLKLTAGEQFCESNGLVFVVFDSRASFTNDELWKRVM